MRWSAQVPGGFRVQRHRHNLNGSQMDGLLIPYLETEDIVFSVEILHFFLDQCIEDSFLIPGVVQFQWTKWIHFTTISLYPIVTSTAPPSTTVNPGFWGVFIMNGGETNLHYVHLFSNDIQRSISQVLFFESIFFSEVPCWANMFLGGWISILLLVKSQLVLIKSHWCPMFLGKHM